MPKIRISRSALDKIETPKSGSVYYFDTALPGFAVRVSPKGVIAFVVQGYIRGVKRRETLGRYPIQAPEDARKAALAFLNNLAQGAAPVRRTSIAAALDDWLAEHGPKLKPRTRADYVAIITSHLKPALGKLAVAEATREDVAAMHRERSATPRRANYVLAVVRSFFSWAEAAGLRPMDSNPARRIKGYPEVRRERFMSEEEIGRAAQAIIATLDAGQISPFAAAALRLVLLTGARRGEISSLRWSEVDVERRMLRLGDSKTGAKPIWLSEPALEILAGLPRVAENPYVFPGDLPGEHYRNLTRAWYKVRDRAGLGDVRLHDLRHTFASTGAAAGLSLPIIGALLGHRVAATTQRYAHLGASPVAEANERIGARLAHIMKGKD